MTKFWDWFFKGTGARPGYKRFIDKWLIFHLLVGILFSLLVPICLADIATTLLLPVAGIFIGLSFAWGGNAQALLQTLELEELADYNDGLYEDYVYIFQGAILLILITLVFWVVAGLKVFDIIWPISSNTISYKSVTAFLFFISSMTLRECWHVVLGAQNLLLMRFHIRRHKRNKTDRQ